MKIELIGGPRDGETFELHEGRTLLLLMEGEYKIETLTGYPVHREGEHVRAYWTPA